MSEIRDEAHLCLATSCAMDQENTSWARWCHEAGFAKVWDASFGCVQIWFPPPPRRRAGVSGVRASCHDPATLARWCAIEAGCQPT